MEIVRFAGCQERQSASRAAGWRTALLTRLMGEAIPCRTFDASRGNALATQPARLARTMPTVTMTMAGCLALGGYARVSLGGQCRSNSDCIKENGTTGQCINKYCEARAGDDWQSQAHCQSPGNKLICIGGVCQSEPGTRCDDSSQCWQPIRTAQHEDWELGPNAKFVCKNETCLSELCGSCENDIDCFPDKCGSNGKYYSEKPERTMQGVCKGISSQP